MIISDENESHENEGDYNEDASEDSDMTTESSGYNTIAS